MSVRYDKSQILRRVGEAAGLAVIVIIFWTLDTLAKYNVRLVDGVGPDDFRLIAEQTTSAFTVWILVPGVAWWLAHFPISPGRIGSKIAGHVIGSALFATAHYFIMIGLRIVIYPLFDIRYQLSDFWLQNLLIEYQKDVKIYVAIVAVVAVYRRVRANRTRRGDRLVVQSGSGEHLREFSDVECLEASRNYVSVHTADREYLLRETIANLEARLAPCGFLRTHRSFLANRECVTGVRSSESGGQQLILTSGREIPLSRSRRDAIREALGL
jgi:hypothetical protein